MHGRGLKACRSLRNKSSGISCQPSLRPITLSCSLVATFCNWSFEMHVLCTCADSQATVSNDQLVIAEHEILDGCPETGSHPTLLTSMIQRRL